MPTRPDDDLPADDPLALPAIPDSTDAGLVELLDAERWPDDDEGDDLPLPREVTASVPLTVDEVDDELGDDDPDFERLVTEEAPPPSLADEPAVIPWRARALVDGVSTPTRALSGEPLSRLFVPGGSGHRTVRVRLAGRRFEATLTVVDGPAELLLGRDLLAGRFLVACD